MFQGLLGGLDWYRKGSAEEQQCFKVCEEILIGIEKVEQREHNVSRFFKNVFFAIIFHKTSSRRATRRSSQQRCLLSIQS